MIKNNQVSISKRQINQAARTLVSSKPDSAEYEEARKIVNDYRTSHAYPLKIFNWTLRRKVALYRGAIVAQRLKRLPTIIDKLSRFETMKLAQMQDIGGVRAVLPKINDVLELTDNYKYKTKFKHELILEHDYIAKPKKEGYRGVHLVYKFVNSSAGNDQADQYNGLSIEMQFRTQLQHSWATAVESVGTLKSESFKTGRGPAVWREFFELVSSAFAIAEDSPVLEKHQSLTAQELFQKIQEFDQKHKILDNLRGLTAATNVLDTNPHTGYYNLVHLDIELKQIKIYAYSEKQLDQATAKYAELESQSGENVDVVLVSVTNLTTLKKAYPNYFLDIRDFVEKISVLTET